MNIWNNEALTAYNFLRFCEDAGIPFRVSTCTIATKTAAESLGRIAEYSSHWALATLVRIDDVKAVDEIFDRASLARMSTTSVNRLIQHYLESLRLAISDIGSGDRWRSSNFGTLLAGVLPEILSRLCCKCSRDAREMILGWLLEVYRSEHRPNYQGIRYVTARLLDAVPVAERVAIVPTLLRFPILAELNPLEERGIPESVRFSGSVQRNDTRRDRDLGHGARPCSSTARRPTSPRYGGGRYRPLGRCSTPGSLIGVSCNGSLAAFGVESTSTVCPLTQTTSDLSFCRCRTRRRSIRLDTSCSTFAAHDFPHRRVKLVRQQKSPETRARHFVVTFAPRRTSSGPRTTCALLYVDLYNGGTNDKAHSLRVRVKGPFPSIARDLGERLSDLIMTLATMVLRYPDSVRDESTRDALTRVAKECPEYGVPSLQLDVAYSYVFADSRESVLERVMAAMGSPSSDTVIDALYAMDFVSRRARSEAEGENLLELLRAARSDDSVAEGTGLGGDDGRGGRGRDQASVGIRR